MIREATAADAGLLADIDAHEPDRWSRPAFVSSLALATSRAFVVGDRGFALVSIVVDEGELLRIVVRPAARRQGTGRGLLGRCHRAFADEGVDRAHLEVREDNVAARALYARHGWIETGRRPRYYSDGCDAVSMQWLRDPRGS